MTPSVLPEASPESVGLNAERLARLSAVMTRQIEDKKAPGLSLLIARHGKIAYRDFIGLLRPGGPPMGEDAIFRIYSMTKPIVSVAAMTLVEEGRLLLSDPAAKYLPVFAETKVGIERDGEIDLKPPERPVTVLDLMRHTSGLTYGFLGTTRIHRMTHEAHILSHHRSMDEHISILAGLPLLRSPGLAWEYSHSTDVLGRIVEIVAERSLGQLLEERIFAPLGMEDTAFHTPPGKVHRRAEPFSMDSTRAANVDTVDATAPPRNEFAGTGLVSTLGDYARFSAMLQGRGALGGVRTLSPRVVDAMTTDHLGARVIGQSPLLEPGHGFGLGFAVRLELGGPTALGSVGEYKWGGWAGTGFWISPRDSMFAILMVQAPDFRDNLREIFRNLVYAALD
jgi:CubicO group peptidase (beta-lactamase class C family)